jgi:geranylgeranyl diphosphate synthase, type II
MTDLKENAIAILENYKSLVWKEISSYLTDPPYPKSFQIPQKYKDKEHKKYWEMLREYPERKGKYLRPTLLLLTCEASGGKTNDALKTAAAMQLSEDWLLLDDDIMDNSTLRRGKPTFHRLFGIDQAIVVGDALQSITTRILADNISTLSPELTIKIITELNQILMRTCEGQSIEAMWTKEKNFTISDEDYFFVVDGKSCYYTIAGPMILGAMIAGKKGGDLDELANFGMYLGRAFQLIDDILGVTSDFGNLKQKAGDIYEGKTTLLVSHMIRNANKEDREKAITILSKSFEEKTEKDVAWFVAKMHEYGSIEYAKTLAEEYKEKAYAMFEKLTFLKKEPARTQLKQLIEFVIERKH